MPQAMAMQPPTAASDGGPTSSFIYENLDAADHGNAAQVVEDWS